MRNVGISGATQEDLLKLERIRGFVSATVEHIGMYSDLTRLQKNDCRAFYKTLKHLDLRDRTLTAVWVAECPDGELVVADASKDMYLRSIEHQVIFPNLDWKSIR